MSTENNSPSKKSDEPTQKTQPKKGEPVEILVPSKSQVIGDFEKIAIPSDRGLERHRKFVDRQAPRCTSSHITGILDSYQ